MATHCSNVACARCPAEEKRSAWFGKLSKHYNVVRHGKHGVHTHIYIYIYMLYMHICVYIYIYKYSTRSEVLGGPSVVMNLQIKL